MNELHYFSGGGATNAALLLPERFRCLFVLQIGMTQLQDGDGGFAQAWVKYRSFYLSKSSVAAHLLFTLSGDRTIFAHRGANTTLLNKELPVDGIKGLTLYMLPLYHKSLLLDFLILYL